MDGTVLQLGNGLVAKIWHRRDLGELAMVRAFYDELAASEPGFAHPRIVDLVEAEGQVATVEPYLAGRPLRDTMGVDTPAPTESDVACVLAVLTALSEVVVRPGLTALPVLEGDSAFSWPPSVHHLARRPGRASGRPLSWPADGAGA